MPDNQPDRVRARFMVSGRVQGVWFRAGTREVATRLGVGGWIRNLPDGEVEGAFEGPRSTVESALDWIRKGPPGAHVEFCDVIWEPPLGEDSFAILHT